MAGQFVFPLPLKNNNCVSFPGLLGAVRCGHLLTKLMNGAKMRIVVKCTPRYRHIFFFLKFNKKQASRLIKNLLVPPILLYFLHSETGDFTLGVFGRSDAPPNRDFDNIRCLLGRLLQPRTVELIRKRAKRPVEERSPNRASQESSVDLPPKRESAPRRKNLRASR
jgi:hypothetical protein